MWKRHLTFTPTQTEYNSGQGSPDRQDRKLGPEPFFVIFRVHRDLTLYICSHLEPIS